MLPKIEDYEQFVGAEQVNKIKDIALKIEDKHIVHLNSTYAGGGVAQILNSLIVLMNRLNIKTDWRQLKGSHSFFDVTKKFHNGLQGEGVIISEKDKKIYFDELERNSIMNHFGEHDLVFIHDPQPLGLIQYNKKKRQPWIWRSHIEIKNPCRDVWNFLLPFANQYDGAIFSLTKYRRADLNIPQYFIAPSIDPLSLKNKFLSEHQVKKILLKEGIDLNKSLITQVSRFDKWKNPQGVLKIFDRVKKKIDAQLILIGDMATDDPEGPKIYNKVIKQAESMKDVKIIVKNDDLLVNALQRASHIILQNSEREGFGLTVTEALWKGTPVIGRRVGGIPLQIVHKKTGILANNSQDAASWCMKLLANENMRIKMGNDAKEHVRKNFLITRQLHDYLKVIDFYTSTVADDLMKTAKKLRKLLLIDKFIR